MVITISDLTPLQQRLVELMQKVNFGRIEGIIIRDGEPILDPLPRIVQKVKFCAENGPRPETGKQNFTLKASVRDLFAKIEALGDGIIHSLEVKHGLPFDMEFEEKAALDRG